MIYLFRAAYDAPENHEFAKDRYRIPIIDDNPQRGKKKEMDPAKKIRYKERSSTERVNSELKDSIELQQNELKMPLKHPPLGLTHINSKK